MLHIGNEPPSMVGYQVFHEDGLYGARGLYFNYVLAGNGLFIEAESPLLSGRVQIAEAQVRGLQPMVPEVYLPHGKIPIRLMELALTVFLANPDVEQYVCVVFEEGEYRLRAPKQTGRGASVEYERLDNVVMDLHSHGKMGAFFSSQDNKDEQGLRLYGVVGGLREVLHMKMRFGIYGYFGPGEWTEVFDGPSFVANKPDKEIEIPDYDPVAPAEYPGGIKPGEYDLVKLLRENADNPEAVRFIADMLEE